MAALAHSTGWFGSSSFQICCGHLLARPPRTGLLHRPSLPPAEQVVREQGLGAHPPSSPLTPAFWVLGLPPLQDSFGCMAAAPYGSSLILPISYAYISMMGSQALTNVSSEPEGGCGGVVCVCV
jgi:hypothetical protein